MLRSDDPTLQYYYDFSTSLEEFRRAFAELEVAWEWQPVTMQNFAAIIDGIAQGEDQPVFLNLCDGDELNGVPGISVLKHLASNNLMFTGAREPFYHVTTCKMRMKRAFEQGGVATSPWSVVDVSDGCAERILGMLEGPLIVKPAISGGSMGIGLRSVVHDVDQLRRQIEVVREGCHGWKTGEGGIFVERFITGREFSLLIVGSVDNPASLRVHEPIERAFDTSLPAHERFLSFDRLWEFYENESRLVGDKPFYNYAPVEGELAERIKVLGLDAYNAVDGSGYGRVDLRMDEDTGELYVLEVNAQCGLSEDENQTDIGAILRFEGKKYSELLVEILQDAELRRISTT
jgi:D-alanine-D-alanine ligase